MSVRFEHIIVHLSHPSAQASRMLILLIRTQRLSPLRSLRKTWMDEGFLSKMVCIDNLLFTSDSDLVTNEGDDFNGRPKAKTEDLDGAKSGLSKMAQKILASQKQPPIPCLFIGNLGFEATEESIRGMIEGHTKALADRSSSKPKRRDDEEKNDMSERSKEGQTVSTGIKKIRMGTFEDSGLCKG